MKPKKLGATLMFGEVEMVRLRTFPILGDLRALAS